MNIVVYGSTVHHEFDEHVLRLINQADPSLKLSFSHLSYAVWQDGEPAFDLSDYELIKGRHVFIFACPITFELECELYDMVAAAKRQYAAASVTLIMSFMRHRRSDHQEKHHEITRLRWFIRRLKNDGADRLVVCTPHSILHTKKFCDEFGIGLYLVDATNAIAQRFNEFVNIMGNEQVKIFAPDFGDIGRAIPLAKKLNVKVVAVDKERLHGDEININKHSSEFASLIQSQFPDDANLISCKLKDLRDCHVLMLDDEISTGGTSVETGRLVRDNGAVSVRLIVVHPVCSPGWKKKLFPEKNPPFEEVYFGDTRQRGGNGHQVPSKYRESSGGKVETITMAPAMAKAVIEVMHKLK